MQGRVSDTTNLPPEPISAIDEAELASIQANAHDWHNATFDRIRNRTAGVADLASYKNALDILRQQAKGLAQKYPENESVANVLTQIEGWFQEL